MPRKYSREYKLGVVMGMIEIEQKGEYDGITSIREYIKTLPISSSTLYIWREEYLGEAKQKIKKHPTKKTVKKPSKKPETEDFFSDSNDAINDENNEKEAMIMILDNTFFMSLARGLGIKNYRRPQKQLWNEIGLVLIKKAGLVEPKAIKGMKL